MSTTTEKYGFLKPDPNDFYDVKEDISDNMDKVEEALSEFDDSGSVEGIKNFPDFLSKFLSGNKLATTLRNLKAGLQFVLHAGQIVNNCVTDNAGLPLSAAQGKVLKDLYTQLYSDLNTTNNNLSNRNPPYAEKTSGAPYGLPNFSYVLGSADNKKGTASGDVYYIAVNSKGRLYGGAQVNNATDITWEETATKDDLGVFLTTYGTKAAVYRSNINITSLNLPAGHTYLILGSTQVDTSVSLISASLSAPSNEYGTTFGLSQMRTTGSNGGGCMTAAIMSLKKDFTVSINGYGYDNATYNYIGYLIAIRLK